jgi:uncharacterized protein YqfB (UPF0267 family)
MQKLKRFSFLVLLASFASSCASPSSKPSSDCGCDHGKDCSCAGGVCNCHGGEAALEADPCLGQPLLTELAFSPEFKQPVLKGEKKATTRLGVRCFAEGQKIRMTDPTKKITWGTLTVKGITHTTFNALTPEIAAREGASLDGLKAGLIGIYGEKIRTEPVTVVDFAPAAR